MIKGEALASAVILRAVADYRQKVWQLSKMNKTVYLWKYDETVADIERLRHFFTEQNIYWDAVNLDGKSILRRIDEQMKGKVKTNE